MGNLYNFSFDLTVAYCHYQWTDPKTENCWSYWHQTVDTLWCYW